MVWIIAPYAYGIAIVYIVASIVATMHTRMVWIIPYAYIGSKSYLYACMALATTYMYYNNIDYIAIY